MDKNPPTTTTNSISKITPRIDISEQIIAAITSKNCSGQA